MAGCFDNVNIECGGCMGDGAVRRNIIASVAAGTIFSIGWWIVIDASATLADPSVRGIDEVLSFVIGHYQEWVTGFGWRSSCEIKCF